MKDRVNAERRAARASAPAKTLQRLKEQRSDKVDQDRAKHREWYQRNAERAKAYASEYRKANRERVNELNARRRARIAGAPVVERVNRAEIIARDKQTCHICRRRVPDGQVALDHLVPLALGGEHSARNLAVAHKSCNSRKWIGAANDQLRLIG